MNWAAATRARAFWHAAAVLVSAAVGIAGAVSGAALGLERTLQAIQWQLRAQPASGNVHIVEIDARSIAAIDRWPWPRSNYAAATDRLREAGVAGVVYDVDFSAHSQPAEDRAFADALARAGDAVVLPTFRQSAGAGVDGWTDSLPIPMLRRHASLAAVSILPDGDGYVRRAPIGTVTAGVPRPSLSAIIAGRAGAAGADFPIDFAIAPSSIPRHSFIDIRDGRFDPRVFAGKQVLIGATAVELGDRYAVPNHGVIPGVVIQALAAETIARAVPKEAGWQLAMVVALLAAFAILRCRSRPALATAMVAAPLALFGGTLAAAELAYWIFPIAPALIAFGTASAIVIAMRVLASLQRRRAHDHETGLPNRLALAGAFAGRAPHGIVAARIADFDRLPAALGADGTVQLVCRVRERIALIAGEATIYRIDDRVLAWAIAESEDLEARLSGLRAAMLSPVEVNGRRIDVSLAIGIAIHCDDALRGLANAALAADRALADGETWHFHSDVEEEGLERELSLLGELDQAVAAGEIQVLYQPKLSLARDRIESVEALVRWHHPTRGLMRPDLFIPLAERNDRISLLTLHIIHQAIADLQTWQADGHRVSAAINLSAKLLTSQSFTDELRSLVDRSGIDPTLLIFEVTESAAMTDPERAAEALRSFREMGIAISMDDYGTGQSTLTYIKRLPLNELKIDRSFVQFAHQNRADAVLVRSTIDLAHELGLTVVAEGVEEADCLAFLRAAGCDYAQGYLISRPIPSADLRTLIRGPLAIAA